MVLSFASINLQKARKTGANNAIGLSIGELSSKISAAIDEKGCPAYLELCAGLVSDIKAAPDMIDALKRANWIIAYRGYSA